MSPAWRLTAASLASLLALMAPSAQAQRVDTLPIGSRVRLTVRTPGPSRWIGTLQALRNDSILLLPEADTARGVLRADVQRLDISRGLKGQPVLRAVTLGSLGAIAIGVAGALVASTACRPDADECMAPLGGLFYGGILGFAAGFVIGANDGRRERWERVRLP